MESKHKRRWWIGWCWMFFLCLVPANALFAQGNVESSTPPIEILKLKWEREVRLPRNFDPAVISAGGTFSDPASRSSNTTANTSTTTTPTGASGPASGDSGLPSPFPATPARMPVDYIYSMKIRNAGSKIIEGIAWDYLFLDPNNLTELGRHQFLSFVKISIDKSVTLQGKLRAPPMRILRASSSSASSSAKDKHPKSIERVAIQCILYADDTFWRNPQARKGVCEFLKNQEALVKRKQG